MATPQLETVCWVLSLFATFFALLAFGRGLAHLWRQISPGPPEPGRLSPVGRRLGMLVTTVLSHREFRGRPLVRAAHWVVMLSFPLLFLTLVSGYAHLRDQHWELPFLGRNPVWLWVVDLFAWGGLLGILALMVFRHRRGRGSTEEASLSGEGASPALPDPARPTPRDGSVGGMASHFLGSTHWQALFVEWVVLVVCACVVVLRGLDAALLDAQGADSAWALTPLTGWMVPLARAAGWGTTSLANGVVLVSTLKIAVSMLWMMVVGVQTSMGIAWHRFLAVLNVFARREADGRKTLGPATPMFVDGEAVTDVDSLDEEARLGIGTVEDFSWKDRLDLYSCTECGRCQELCPAWNTRKPLSPKLLVLSLRDHMASVGTMEVSEREVTDAEVPGGAGLAGLAEDRMLMEKGLEPSPHTPDVLDALTASGATGPQGVSSVAAPLIGEVVPEEVLWDCTTCGACVEQCPVDIEHIDHVLDLRRHQVLMESAFPRELGRAFRGMESKGNPYNQPARKRLDWAKGLDFAVPVIGEDVEDASEVDYLFWVGCAGAFDDRARATTAAVATLLHTAGVSFAVLGSAESCTGDAARRAGNEVLFQMLARAAIETLTEARTQRIVVTCAHCFNTIAGEFPQLGGRFEVIHHTQLLNRLVRDGLLRPEPAEEGEGREVTYHDPCYLGRHNRVYSPPRELIGALPGVTLTEMPRHAERAMCCGAGGAHAWMEETRGVRIADARMAEAAATGASTVVTACPFCTQMLGSATGASAGLLAAEDTSSAALPEVKDVAVMLLEAVGRGEGAVR